MANKMKEKYLPECLDCRYYEALQEDVAGYRLMQKETYSNPLRLGATLVCGILSYPLAPVIIPGYIIWSIYVNRKTLEPNSEMNSLHFG